MAPAVPDGKHAGYLQETDVDIPQQDKGSYYTGIWQKKAIMELLEFMDWMKSVIVE